MATPSAPTAVDAAALADELARLRLVSPDQLTDLLNEFPGGGPGELAGFLVGRGALTPFQAARALAGEIRTLAPGPYRLAAIHRVGTLGPMFRAVHTSKPGAFAVQLLPLRSLWQARQAKSLVRSFARLAAHPGVVALIDAGTANGSHFLVWPLADDELLADRVARDGPLPPHEAAAALAHLADTLVACHARQVPHGLLSPWAVGLAADGRWRLLELGAGLLLAQNLAAAESLFDTLTTTRAVVGSLNYAAPELIADPTTPTPAADRFALGAVGFFALTGRPPFDHGAITDRLLARQLAPPSVREVNPNVPAELAAVIDRLLQPTPADRYDRTKEARDWLTDVAEQLDPVRPVLVSPSESLAAQHADDSTDAPNPAAADSGSGSVSWASLGSGVTRLPERDASDASIQFDLPADLPADPGGPLQSIDTPRQSVAETQPSTRSRRPALMIEAGIAPEPPSAPQPSPATSEPPTMAPPLPDPFRAKTLPPTPPPIDPRLSLPIPVQWHTGDSKPGVVAVPPPDELAPANSVMWKKVKRNLLFWQASTDIVWVSVFGPPAVTPGQTVKLTVFLHTPEAVDSVRTLARAFHHDSELIGSGTVAREVSRESVLAVHLSVTNAAVSKSLVELTWLGQPRRLGFDLHVPWESPSGPAPGLVSVGQDEVRIGKVAYHLHVLPRKS